MNTRRKWLAIGLVLAVMILGGVSAWNLYQNDPSVIKQKLDSTIRSIPAGCSRARAEKELRAAGVKYHYLGSPGGEISGLAGRIPFNSLITSGEVRFYLVFDEDDRLEDWQSSIFVPSF